MLAGETALQGTDSPDKNRSAYRLLLPVFFIFLALLNLSVMVQANQLAFSGDQQPYDFYVLLHASSQVFSAPSMLYVHQDTSSLPAYWAKWLWYGASYLYTPMFAVLLSPLASVNPPDARIIWESLSYALLVVSCFAILKVVPSTKAKFLLTLMIFIMPIQIIYTDQTLPQYWLPQMPGMWVSPAFFTDYYWGNTNTAILALGLLSYYFAARQRPIDIGVIQIPSYVLSSLFLALDTFKPTATLLILPFWIALNRKKLWSSVGYLLGFTALLNSVILFEPALLTSYLSAISNEPQAALWQVYEYVWYYTLPITGFTLLCLGRKGSEGSKVLSLRERQTAKSNGGPLHFVAVVLMLFLMVSTSIDISPVNATSLQTNLASHWVPGWGFRDELNTSEIDNQNFWTDNAGKILTMAMITHDLLDADRAVQFLTDNQFGGYYLPETVINSTGVTRINGGTESSVTNGIVELKAGNDSSFGEQLAIGNYYAGYLPLAYIGVHRIWMDSGKNCCAYRDQSSRVFSIPKGFSERSLFVVNGSKFYVYVNATLAARGPDAQVSLQLERLNSSGLQVNYIFLQLFNSSRTYPFQKASLYAPNGAFVSNLPSRSASPTFNGGIVLAYSNQTSVFTVDNKGDVSGQDAVALSFGNQSVYDVEHWTNDVPFSHSWLGIGYTVPGLASGMKSTPVQAQVYPIEHFDYRLANDTARYIASSPSNVSVAPPVSFGFLSYGLSLLARSNSSYSSLAKGYWNYYFHRYSSSSYSPAYSRSTSLLALAGFELYGCNSTVIEFAIAFIGYGPGSSIEEYGWAAAVLHQLYRCTQYPPDLALFQQVTGSFSYDADHFVNLTVRSTTPEWTFQFGESASGLMLGGVPFNEPSVLGSMNAVYQSNINGTVMNKPFHNLWANTETLPAYMLSTWLFEGEMRNATGYWISSLANCNMTSISYTGSALSISAIGRNGTLTLSNADGSKTYLCNGSVVLGIQTGSQSIRWLFLIVVALVVVVLLLVYYFLRRSRLLKKSPASRGKQPTVQEMTASRRPLSPRGSSFP